MAIYRWNKARLLLASLGLAIASPGHVIAEEPRNRSIEGNWRGDFGAGQWTFTFARVKGEWSGKYSYPQYNGTNPLVNLSASERHAKFSIKAKTSVDFDLKLGSSKEAMSGTVRFGQGVTPGSDPVVVPVQLKRVL